MDHVITHLETQFPNNLEDVLIATYLLPSYLTELTPDIITKITIEFETIVLPSLSQFSVEVNTWKVHIKELEMTEFEKIAYCTLAIFHCNIKLT